MTLSSRTVSVDVHEVYSKSLIIKCVDNCEMLHGGLKDDERVAAVERFQNDENVFVFLISKLLPFSLYQDNANVRSIH
jgi:hypothetical protein